MDKKIYFGIDGGGTKSSLVVTDEHLNELFKCVDGPSNFLAIGLEKASANIINLIRKTSLNIDLKNRSISIVVGVAGAGRLEDSERLEGALKIRFRELHLQIESLLVTSDAEIALEGAFSGNSGALLIAGTGSILFGKNQFGVIKRVGGYGRILGDEGSGYSIGNKALKSVAEYYDGRAPKSVLVDLLAENFEIKSLDDIINKVYKEDFDIASLVPSVLSATENEDNTSILILEDEAEQLLILIEALRLKLNIDEMNLCFMGSLLTNKNYYSIKLKNKIEKLNNINVVNLQYSPEIGAIMLEKRRLLNNE